jgi:hypothetical protein
MRGRTNLSVCPAALTVETQYAPGKFYRQSLGFKLKA